MNFNASPFSAEYGRVGGAVMTAVSRSGSNDWHGSLYWYHRNSALDARNYFDSPNEKIPPLRKHHFGGLVSGPVKPNRVFFLLNFEGIRETSSRTDHPTTLSDDGRRGILNGSEGPGAASIDPSVRPFLDLYPLANGRDFGDGTAEFIAAIGTNTEENYTTGKIDLLGSDNVRVSGSYTFDDGRQDTQDYFRIWNLVSGSRYQFARGHMHYTQSPDTVHEFRVGFSRVGNRETAGVLHDLALRNSFLPGKSMGILEVAGLSDIGGSRNLGIGSRPRRYTVDDVQADYQATGIRGAHSLRAGATYDHIQFDQRADLNATGQYTFGSIEDFFGAKPLAGEFMSPESDTRRFWRMHQFSAFFQDEFRVHPSLTLSLGARYDAHSTPSERDGKISTIRDPLRDTQATLGGPLFRNPSLKNIAPRASLAWDVTGAGNTVIRAGFGIFYDLIGSRELVIAGVRMPPFYRNSLVNQPIFPDLLAAISSKPPLDSPDAIDYYLNQPYVMKY